MHLGIILKWQVETIRRTHNSKEEEMQNATVNAALCEGLISRWHFPAARLTTGDIS
jgi:hypothetical protein